MQPPVTAKDLQRFQARLFIDEENRRITANMVEQELKVSKIPVKKEMLPDNVPLNVRKINGAYRVQNITVHV